MWRNNRPHRFGFLPAALALLSVALLVPAALAAAATKAPLKVGEAFPDLQAAGLSGQLPSTAGKVVVVDFWASWCAPCKASFPAYAKIHADYGSKGLAIVAVSIDEKQPDYESFVKRLSPPFATVRDAQHTLVAGVVPPAMPTSYVLGRDGRVRFINAGYKGAESDRELRKQIEQLLAEK